MVSTISHHKAGISHYCIKSLYRLLSPSVILNQQSVMLNDIYLALLLFCDSHVGLVFTEKRGCFGSLGFISNEVKMHCNQVCTLLLSCNNANNVFTTTKSLSDQGYHIWSSKNEDIKIIDGHATLLGNITTYAAEMEKELRSCKKWLQPFKAKIFCYKQ